MKITPADQRWAGKTVIVCAPGPSLTEAVAAQVDASPHPKLAVNDAFKRVQVDILYACDNHWWAANPETRYLSSIELWTTHDKVTNDKTELAKVAPANMFFIGGQYGSGFSTDPATLHYGHNSGFQAVNLALLMGAKKVILVGFNMQRVEGKTHFFGEYPLPFVNTEPRGYARFLQAFDAASGMLPAGVDIVNCTPDSALMCFRKSTLEEELL